MAFFNSWNRSSTFFIGQRFQLPIKKIVPMLGMFFELSPGFDALLHKSKIPNGDLSAFFVGQICQIEVCFIDEAGRVQLAFVDETMPPPVAGSAEMPRMSAAMWRQTHPVEDAKAVEWLRITTRDSALHATLLAELKTRFGVPSPISAWVKLHSDTFVNFGPKNPVSTHPCCGLVSRLQDPAYWTAPIRALPSAIRIQVKSSEARLGRFDRHPGYVAVERKVGGRPQTYVSGQKQVLLLDGSNLIRTLPSGGKALAALLLALERAGYRYNVLFDATIRHVLEEAQDATGLHILASCAHQVTIVPAGTPADDYLLLLADRKGYAVASNDRFEQYRDRYPWLAARVESDDRRLHAVAEIDGELVAPTLGLVVHI